MDKKMKDEFIQMLKDARGTPQEWSVIMAMVDMLEDDDEFEDMAVSSGHLHRARPMRRSAT